MKTKPRKTWTSILWQKPNKNRTGCENRIVTEPKSSVSALLGNGNSSTINRKVHSSSSKQPGAKIRGNDNRNHSNHHY